MLVGVLSVSVSVSVSAGASVFKTKTGPEWPPWMVRVSSVYDDEISGRPSVTEIGTGTLVGFGGQTYVLTASHVSQGRNLQITSVGGDLKVLGRLSINGADLELIEVQYIPQLLYPVSRIPKKYAYPLAEYQDYAKLFVVNFYIQDSWFQKTPPRDSIWIDRQNFVCLTPWSSFPTTLETPVLTPRDPANPFVFKWTSLGLERSAPITIFPGMSGSPLVGRTDGVDGVPSTQWVIHGVATRALRQFATSYFSSAQQIFKVFESYRSGARRVLDSSVTWHMRYGLPHRDYGGGLSEINPLSRTTGNGISRDGGNGTSRDGGRGGAQPLSKVWEDLQIRPGILYKSQPTLGLRIIDRQSRRHYLFWADPVVWELLKFPELSHLEIEPIPVGGDLSSVLEERLGFAAKSARPREWTRVAHELDPVSFLPDQKVSIQPDGSLLLKFLGPHAERFELNFNAHGELDQTPGTGFLPVVEWTNKEKTLRCSVDLRNLYFSDLSALQIVGTTGALSTERRISFFRFVPERLATETREIFVTVRCGLDSTTQNEFVVRFHE